VNQWGTSIWTWWKWTYVPSDPGRVFEEWVPAPVTCHGYTYGSTPLILATRQGHVDIVKLLLAVQGIDIHAIAHDGDISRALVHGNVVYTSSSPSEGRIIPGEDYTALGGAIKCCYFSELSELLRSEERWYWQEGNSEPDYWPYWSVPIRHPDFPRNVRSAEVVRQLLAAEESFLLACNSETQVQDEDLYQSKLISRWTIDYAATLRTYMRETYGESPIGLKSRVLAVFMQYRHLLEEDPQLEADLLEDWAHNLTEDEAGWAMPSESEDLTFDQANAHSSGGRHNRKETEQETEVIRWLHCNFQDMRTAETVESMYSNYRRTLVQTRRDLPRGRPGAIVSKGEFARIVRKTFPNYHFCGKPGSDRSKKTRHRHDSEDMAQERREAEEGDLQEGAQKLQGGFRADST